MTRLCSLFLIHSLCVICLANMRGCVCARPRVCVVCMGSWVNVFVHLSMLLSPFISLIHLSLCIRQAASSSSSNSNAGMRYSSTAEWTNEHFQKSKKKNEYGVPVGIYTIRLYHFCYYCWCCCCWLWLASTATLYAHVPISNTLLPLPLAIVVTLIGYYAYFLCETTQLLYACVFLICVQAFKHFFAFVRPTNFASWRTPPKTYTHGWHTHAHSLTHTYTHI